VTPEIVIVLAILTLAVILFVTERIRVDVVALMVLVGLALTGLVAPAWPPRPRRSLALVTSLWCPWSSPSRGR
jgi:di/tricarboxylate transporter